MFITFEGPEGCGETTQISILASWLRSRGLRVLCTREPGGTLIGDQVRSILTRLDNTVMAPEAELCLFLASRAQLVKEVVVPAFSAGTIVLCDRFTDARLAYQGYGHGLDVQFLKSLNMFATGGLVPDMTVLLDDYPEIGIERRRSSGGEWNRLDAMVMTFYQRVGKGYHILAADDPSRWRTIDAYRPFDDVS
jgi:dTMP kinase